MRRRGIGGRFLAFLLLIGCAHAFSGEAATVEARALPGVLTVEVRLTPAEGVKLYRDRVKVELVAPTNGVTLGKFELPPAQKKAFDEAEGGEVGYYTAPVSFAVPLLLLGVGPDFEKTPVPFTLRVHFQGCTDKTCFPPTSREFKLEVAQSEAPEVAPPPLGGTPASEEKRNPFVLILLAFLAGLGICYTPCVYPMIPVTVAVIGGVAGGGKGGEKPGRLRLLAYTLTYVLGIAITYAVLGVIAARAGAAMGPLMQHPAVLTIVAAVMIALALSMFGAFDLALPAGLAGRLGNLSGGGSLPALLLSGLVLGLAASPCVSAPLGGLLLSIGKTGNWLVGGLALFAFAWGMSALLIVAGIFPGLLARPGPWMLRVKAVFGIILAAMALYFARSLVPAAIFEWGFIAFILAAGIALLAGGARGAEGSRLRGLAQGLGAVLLTLCAYLAFGIAFRAGALDSFARLVLPPAVTRQAPGGKAVRGGPAWQPYSAAAFDAAVKSGRPVLVDFFADWCAACHEMEEKTFSDAKVIAAAGRFVLLRVDGSDAASQAVKDAQARFGVFGYPTVVLFGEDGREAARLEGFTPPAAFLEKMKAVRTMEQAS